MNECLRCGRHLKDPVAMYGWRCAKKLGVSTHGMLADDEVDRLAERFLRDQRRGEAGKWYGKSLEGQTISPLQEDHLLFPPLEVFQYVQKYNMEYTGTFYIARYSDYIGFDVAIFRSYDAATETEYMAKVIYAEKTVSEWYDFIAQKYQLAMGLRKFLQYGGDSGAFDYIIGQLVSNPAKAMLLGLVPTAVSFLLGDAPPEMNYILEHLEGHTDDEKVMVVFYEEAQERDTGHWSLNEWKTIHTKKHF